MQREILTMLMLYQQIGQASQRYPGVKVLIGSLIPTPKSGTMKLDSAFKQMELLSKHVIEREHFKKSSEFSYICRYQYSNHLYTELVWYSNGGLKTGLKKARFWSNSRVIKRSTKSCDIIILILDTHTVQYSDESGI